MLEPLRKRVVEAEAVLRENYDFSDHDLSGARSNGMHRSWNWFYGWPREIQKAIIEYQDALRTLATEEKQEIESLKRNK